MRDVSYVIYLLCTLLFIITVQLVLCYQCELGWEIYTVWHCRLVYYEKDASYPTNCQPSVKHLANAIFYMPICAMMTNNVVLCDLVRTINWHQRSRPSHYTPHTSDGSSQVHCSWMPVVQHPSTMETPGCSHHYTQMIILQITYWFHHTINWSTLPFSSGSSSISRIEL